MNPQVPSALRNFIAETFFYERAHALGEDDSLLEAGIIDSTGVLELVTFLESTYGIRVDDADVVPENLDTIGRIAAYVQRKLPAPTLEVSHAS
jgi:acyl carrier protein